MIILSRAAVAAVCVVLHSVVGASAATIIAADFRSDAITFDFDDQTPGDSNLTIGELIISGGVVIQGYGNYYYDGDDDYAPFQISFANPVSAVGIDIFTSPSLNSGVMTAYDSSGSILSLEKLYGTYIGGPCRIPCGFFGLRSSSNSIASITYSVGDNNDAWGVSSVSYQTVAPVPLPASSLLLLGGLAGLGSIARRRFAMASTVNFGR